MRNAVIIALLACGAIASYLVVELYPSPILPGFARVPDLGDTVDVERPVIIALSSDRPDTVDHTVLFPSSHVSTVELTRTLFYRTERSPVMRTAAGTGLYGTLKNTRTELRERFGAMFPAVARAQRKHGVLDEPTRQWFRERLASLHLPRHGRSTGLRVEWHRGDEPMPFDVVEIRW
jgi:hypothetical protein